MSDVLEVRGLTKSFGGFTAVEDVDVAVADGAIHAVIGPNGAGKTTLFGLLTGRHVPTRGQVRLCGRDVTGVRTHRVARAGLVQVFQMTNVYPRLSVIDSVRMALLAGTRWTTSLWRRPGRAVGEEAQTLLGEVGLDGLADREAGALSHGDQRALELALALASRPRVLLLDEPTAGMSPYETERMVALVRDLKASRGITVVLSEHDMDVVFNVSDVVTVLHRGRVIKEGQPEEIATDDEVIAVYLGGEGG